MEINKPYSFGLFVGRFEHFHIGHELIVETALKLCDKLIILISDADVEVSKSNPFTIEIREKIINEIYPNEAIVIGKLNRFTNNDSDTIDWRKYALQAAEKIAGCHPNFIIYGSDVTFNPWFDTRGIQDMIEIIVPRSKIEISATEIREFLINDDNVSWKKYTNPSIHHYYSLLKDELNKVLKSPSKN